MNTTMETKAEVKISVQCSPKTFQRMQVDPEYRDEVTQHIKETHGDFKEIEVGLSAAEGEQAAEPSQLSQEDVEWNDSQDNEENFAHYQSQCEEDGNAGHSRSHWLEAPTKLMISLYDKYRPLVGKSTILKTKNKMWQLISKEIQEKGYHFSSTQVQAKYQALERQFKKTKLHNSKTGRDKKTCAFESELNRSMEQKRGWIPDYTLDNEEVEGTSREQMLVNAGMNSTNDTDGDDDLFPSTSDENATTTPQATPPIKRRKQNSTQEKILAKINDIGSERASYHDKILQFLERKEDRENKKIKILEEILANIKRE